MITIHSINEIVEELQGVTATVGNFDGLHLGHRAIISDVTETAKALNQKSLVITFDPHPVKVLFPQAHLRSVFPTEDKVQMLEKLGVDMVLIEPFSRELSQLEPAAFFKKFILDVHVKNLFVGHDFNFGRNRTGTLDVLLALCQKHNVKLKVVAAVEAGGAVVSSTRIRQVIQVGQVQEAYQLLGRPFYMKGVVERGAGRGKKLGFPTANLFTNSEIFPKNGVYMTLTRLGKELHKSITNVGVNPTFSEQNRRPIQVETHILEFDQDIYGETIEVHFLDFIRAEMKFNSVDQLIAQMQNDVGSVRNRKWPQNI